MKNEPIQSKIKLLMQVLDKENILDSLVRIYNYPDEPQMFRFSATIGNIDRFSDNSQEDNTASGFSFESKSLALLKCLVESIERFATLCYRERDLTYSTYKNLNSHALDPVLFSTDIQHRSEYLGWFPGYDLFTEQKTLIPAQTVFYNYKTDKPEIGLTVQVSTGAAGGFDHESTLLRGIYEVIERDAFMGIYLAKIKAPRIDIKNLEIPTVKKIVEKTKRYKLELLLFDITSDLKIPTYLAAVIDRTGLGPSISLGLKSSLSPERAIIGSIEESLLTRPWMRNEMLIQETNHFSINASSLNSIKDRGLFWISPKMLKHLDFLINQRSKQTKIKYFNEVTKTELKLVKQLLLERKIKAYYVNITPKEFKKTGIVVLKVIIPELQPLYFSEKKPEIRTARINQIANHFNKKNYTINKVPHPFL